MLRLFCHVSDPNFFFQNAEFFCFSAKKFVFFCYKMKILGALRSKGHALESRAFFFSLQIFFHAFILIARLSMVGLKCFEGLK